MRRLEENCNEYFMWQPEEKREEADEEIGGAQSLSCELCVARERRLWHAHSNNVICDKRFYKRHRRSERAGKGAGGAGASTGQNAVQGNQLGQNNGNCT